MNVGALTNSWRSLGQETGKEESVPLKGGQDKMLGQSYVNIFYLAFEAYYSLSDWGMKEMGQSRWRLGGRTSLGQMNGQRG